MPLVRSKLGTYVLREVVPMYLVGIVLFLVLRTTDLVSSVVGLLLRNHTGFGLGLGLYLAKLPSYASEAMVLAVPIGVLLAFGRLGRDSEVKAALSAGVRPVSLLWPTVLAALGVGAVAFWNGSFLTPQGNQRWTVVINRIYYRTDPPPQNTSLYNHAEGGNLYYAGTVRESTDRRRPGQADLYGVMVQTPQGTYTAQNGSWDARARTWTLQDAWLVAPGQAPRYLPGTQTFPQRDVLGKPPPPPETLALPELRARVGRVDAGTEIGRQYRYELAKRYADPLAAVGFALLAGALGLLIRVQAWSFGAVVAVIAGFYVVWSFMPQVVKLGAFSPTLAAWLPDLLLVGLAALLFRRLT